MIYPCIRFVVGLVSVALLICPLAASAASSVYKSYSQARGFPMSMPASGKRVFVFDPNLLKWGAYGPNGGLVAYGKASGGAHYCKDTGRACKTPSGTYQVFRKGDYNCESSKYPTHTNGGAWMPWCMHFYKGYAIHGSPHVPGYNASHGCVRVHIKAATWLRHNFMQTGTVVITRPYHS